MPNDAGDGEEVKGSGGDCGKREIPTLSEEAQLILVQ